MLPADSLVAVHGREKLENDILFVAGSREVQNALQQYLPASGKSQSTASSSAASCRIAQAAKKGKECMREEFMEGVRMMIEASCDRRLEMSHWMLGMLWEDREEVSGLDLVEWFFEEARLQVSEMEEADAIEIQIKFGSRCDGEV